MTTESMLGDLRTPQDFYNAGYGELKRRGNIPLGNNKTIPLLEILYINNDELSDPTTNSESGRKDKASTRSTEPPVNPDFVMTYRETTDPETGRIRQIYNKSPYAVSRGGAIKIGALVLAGVTTGGLSIYEWLSRNQPNEKIITTPVPPPIPPSSPTTSGLGSPKQWPTLTPTSEPVQSNFDAKIDSVNETAAENKEVVQIQIGDHVLEFKVEKDQVYAPIFHDRVDRLREMMNKKQDIHVVGDTQHGLHLIDQKGYVIDPDVIFILRADGIIPTDKSTLAIIIGENGGFLPTTTADSVQIATIDFSTNDSGYANLMKGLKLAKPLRENTPLSSLYLINGERIRPTANSSVYLVADVQLGTLEHFSQWPKTPINESLNWNAFRQKFKVPSIKPTHIAQDPAFDSSKPYDFLQLQ